MIPPFHIASLVQPATDQPSYQPTNQHSTIGKDKKHDQESVSRTFGHSHLRREWPTEGVDILQCKWDQIKVQSPKGRLLRQENYGPISGIWRMRFLHQNGARSLFPFNNMRVQHQNERRQFSVESRKKFLIPECISQNIHTQDTLNHPNSVFEESWDFFWCKLMSGEDGECFWGGSHIFQAPPCSAKWEHHNAEFRTLISSN